MEAEKNQWVPWVMDLNLMLFPSQKHKDLISKGAGECGNSPITVLFAFLVWLIPACLKTDVTLDDVVALCHESLSLFAPGKLFHS